MLMSEIAPTFRNACQALKARQRIVFIYIVSILRIHEWSSRTMWSSAAQHGELGLEIIQYERIITKLILKRRSISGPYCACGNCCTNVKRASAPGNVLIETKESSL